MKKNLSIAILLSGISLGFAKDVKLETEKTPNVQTINTTNSLVKNGNKELTITKVSKVLGHIEHIVGAVYGYEDGYVQVYYYDFYIWVP